MEVSATFRNDHTNIMIRRALNYIGGTMFIIWLVEYFGYNAGEETHLLLIFAIIVFSVKTLMYLPSNGKI